jgi:hypothetical protein
MLFRLQSMSMAAKAARIALYAVEVGIWRGRLPKIPNFSKNLSEGFHPKIFLWILRVGVRQGGSARLRTAHGRTQAP